MCSRKNKQWQRSDHSGFYGDCCNICDCGRFPRGCTRLNIFQLDDGDDDLYIGDDDEDDDGDKEETMMKTMTAKLVNLSWRLTTWLIDQLCGFCATIRMRLRTRAILLQISRKTGVFFWPLVAHCPPIAMTSPHMPTIAALCQRSGWARSPSWSYFFKT